VSRPVLLDAFCGAGGATRGYQEAGFYVIGVDNRPQPHYCGDEFVQADAMEVLADPDKYFDRPEEFAAVHASPPCQAYTAMKVMANHRPDHPDLVAPTRELLDLSGLPWVMENVPGAPMEVGPPDLFGNAGGVTLCGSQFGLNNGQYELRRHRLFECSVPLPQPSCRHKLPVIGFYGDHARTRQRTVNGHRDRGGDIVGLERKMPLVRELLGIDWMRWDEAVLAIPPAYTRWIGAQLLAHIESKVAP